MLNGCSSSGKSSLIRAFQGMSQSFWLATGIDAFIDMVPQHKMEHYFVQIPGHNRYGPTMRVENTPAGVTFFGQLPSFVQLCADRGHDLIIDEVLFDEQTLALYRSVLREHQFLYVGVLCELAQLQQREIMRKDRKPGLANDQFHRIHEGIRKNYDFTVDTTHLLPKNAAEKLLEWVEKRQ